MDLQKNNKFHITINRNIPSTADKHEAAKYVKGWELTEVPFDKESLTELTTTYSYMPSKLKDGQRKKANVEEAYFLPLDFDSETSIKEFQKTADSWNYCYFLITTASHQKDKGGKVADRFRVIIPFSRPVSMEEMRKMEQYFLSIFPSLDTGSFHAERYFYKSPKGAITHFHYRLDKYGNAKFFDPNIALKYTQEKPEEKKARRGRPRKEPEKTFSKNTELERYDGTTIIAGDVTEKTKIFCPFCTHKERGNPDKDNAFIDLNERSRFYIYCSSEDKTFWQEAGELGRFSVSNNEESYGYYEYDKKGLPKRLCNFQIKFDLEIQTEERGAAKTYFMGKVILGDGKAIGFDKLTADTLSESGALKKFLTNLCGARIHFEDPKPSGISSIAEAVKWHNEDVTSSHTIEFGFNESRTVYHTPNYDITCSGIFPVQNYMKYDDAEYLNLDTEIQDDIFDIFGLDKSAEDRSKYDILCSGINYDLMGWDELEVTFLGLAFALSPIAYSFLEEDIKSKPYQLLVGPSGSGKSLWAGWFQNFFGYHKKLATWTSTDTFITVAGERYKDGLFAVDDFKKANFAGKDYEKMLRLLQNYGDGNSRKRSNTKLEINDDPKIKGMLLISAEDTPSEQSSTLARGIILETKSKDPDYESVDMFNDLSRYFPAYTMRYIEWFLKNYDKKALRKKYREAKKYIESHDGVVKKSNDNLARVIGNFAFLKTSLDLVLEFSYQDELERAVAAEKANNALIETLNRNLTRVTDNRADEKFIEYLIEFAKSGKGYFQNYDDLDENRYGTRIGYYSEIEGKVVISKAAFLEIERYLSDQGGIGLGVDQIITALESKGLLYSPESKVSICGHKIHGYLCTHPKLLDYLEIHSAQDNSKSSIDEGESSHRDKSTEENQVKGDCPEYPEDKEDLRQQREEWDKEDYSFNKQEAIRLGKKAKKQFYEEEYNPMIDDDDPI